MLGPFSMCLWFAVEILENYSKRNTQQNAVVISEIKGFGIIGKLNLICTANQSMATQEK